MFLSLNSLLNFTNSTSNSRNFIEGEKLINAGHIICCGIAAESDTQYELTAFCLQTSNLMKGSPHEISITIEKNNTVKLAKCSCKAGLSEKCKHIVASLIYCTRNNVSTLSILSSTDKKCIWSAPRNKSLEKYKPGPLRDHECFEISNSITSAISEDVKRIIREKLYSVNSALSAHIVGRHAPMVMDIQLPSPEYLSQIQHIFTQQSDSIFLTTLSHIPYKPLRECCECMMQKFKDTATNICVQSKDSFAVWKRERQFRITGSRCYSLYTYKNNLKADWEKKSSNYFYAKDIVNKYVRHGIQYEPIARKLYEEIYSVKIFECGLIISILNPWLGYSPDGIVFQGHTPSKLIEIKCPYAGLTKNIEDVSKDLVYLNIDNENNLYLKKKHLYYAQIQFGLTVLNIKEAELILYAPYDKSMKIIPIHYDEQFVQDLFISLKQIYFNNMLHFVCLKAPS